MASGTTNELVGGHRKIGRRQFLGLSAASAGAVVLGGCGLSDQDQSDSGSGGSGTITFVHWRGEDQAVFASIIEKFQQETQTQVNQRVLPSDQYQAQLQSDLLGGAGADVFATFPGSQFVNLADAGIYADLSDASFRDAFRDDFLDPGRLNGKQLAYPYQLVFNQPVYNKGIMEQHNLNPEDINSWDGFLGMCDTLKQGGVTPILYAGDISPSQFINPMLMNNQPSPDVWEQVEAGEAKVTEPWYVKTLSQIGLLQERGYYQNDPLGSSKEGTSASFAQENGAMLALGSYMMATIEQQNPQIDQGLLAPITVPASEKQWDGIHTATFMLAVNEKSQNKEAANEWIEFLTQQEMASEYANATGQLLTLKDVNYEGKVLQAQEPWLDKKTLFQPRYTITEPDITEGVETSVNDVLAGMPPEKAAAKLQEVVDRTIQG